MLILAVITLFILLTGAATLVHAVKHAEDGFENESGFHFSHPRSFHARFTSQAHSGSRVTTGMPAGLPSA
ncbi:MAG: hypothetical protein ABIZ49_11765 [Opitutaceae bacterium]